MNIVRAKQKDLGKIMGLIDRCIEDMQKNGIEQWGSFYPTFDIIDDDLLTGHLYAATEDNTFVGIVVITEDQETEYNAVKWKLNETPILIVHRLAVCPNHQKKGIATALMDYAEKLAKKREYKSIRLDTYSANDRSIALFEKRNYIKRGEVNFDNRPLPFYCYEKAIN